MAGNKIRTFLDLVKSGESVEAAIAASGVSPATAKIQLRKNGLADKLAKTAKPAKAAKKSVKKAKKGEDEDEDNDDEDEDEDEDEDVDLDDIA